MQDAKKTICSTKKSKRLTKYKYVKEDAIESESMTWNDATPGVVSNDVVSEH